MFLKVLLIQKNLRALDNFPRTFPLLFSIEIHDEGPVLGGIDVELSNYALLEKCDQIYHRLDDSWKSRNTANLEM